ncbi:hypothetical protein CFC21_025323 [Triticum aestivum]|uniref:Uncharacterized protein n=3 Tax=Triticum TaxID=4564 RepID=A0A9R1PZ18_TRITD|nr:late embryogenesis abundant protein 18-like [Triticum aestivum]KAF7010963.1 hypothetical protein CFC21_025323 [Triticum aestivum]VAH51681.1 unnamed protein product [Triticum turgidum subsp. durum]
MQTAKVKMKDAVSSAKEKAKEGTAKAQGKTGKATATTHGEKEMAKEETRANKSQAKAEMHQEKAEHRAEAAAGRHGATHVPLTGPHGHHRPVGAGAGAAPAAADPAYPGTGAYPTTDKYV